MFHKKKKGVGIFDMGSLVLTFFVIAVIIVFGANILSSFQQTVKIRQTRSIINETTGNITANGLNNLAYGAQAGGAGDTVSVSQVMANGTRVVDASNYTVDTRQGRINVSDASFNGLRINVSYTYSNDVTDATYNASSAGLNSLTTISGWLPTIALVVVASLIVGVIFTYLMKNER